MSIFASKKSRSPIQRAKLLGMRTAQETLIFSTVNFTIYSFWVEYENGFSETVEISPQNPNDKSGKEKKLFHELMSTKAAEKDATPETLAAARVSAVSEGKIEHQPRWRCKRPFS